MGVHINSSVIVQMVGFLILLFLLNIILYKPLLITIKKREKNINDLIDKANELNKKANDREYEYDNKIKLAEKKAKEQYVMELKKALEKKEEMIKNENERIKSVLLSKEREIEDELKNEIVKVKSLSLEMAKTIYMKVVT